MKYLKLGLVAFGIALAATPAKADTNPFLDFLFHLSHPNEAVGPAPSPYGTLVIHKRQVAERLAERAEKEVGIKWVSTALKLGKVESGYNCKATGPRLRQGDRAIGLGQLRLSSARALGYEGSAKGLYDCETNMTYMLAHIKKCEQEGASTEQLMSRCYVGGWYALHHKLRRGAERYARSYEHMVAGTRRINVAMR